MLEPKFHSARALREPDTYEQRTPKRRAPFNHALITPPEVANTGPGANRGSGGGARGCGFEERVGVHARTGWVRFPIPILSVSKYVVRKMTVISGRGLYI